MKVKNWMVRDVVTIGSDASIADAAELMHRHSIRHLPVVDGKRMIGLVTESNMRQYMFHRDSNSLKLSDVMIMNPITIDPNASLDSAARLIYEYKIGGLPVLEKRQLVGMITIHDILTAFIELFGLLQESTRIDLMLAEEGGTLDDALRIVREQGGKILSVALEIQGPKKKIHHIRLGKGDLKAIIDGLEDQGHRIVSVLE